MLDALGQRYGQLPSAVLESGDTLDIQILLTSIEYESWRQEKIKNGQTPTHHSQSELLARLESVRAYNEQTTNSSQVG